MQSFPLEKYAESLKKQFIRKVTTSKQKLVPWWLSGKESACDVGDLGSIPGSGRSPGEGLGNPLQSSCLDNLMDRGAWQVIVHGIAKSQARPSDQHFQKGYTDGRELLWVWGPVSQPPLHLCASWGPWSWVLQTQTSNTIPGPFQVCGPRRISNLWVTLSKGKARG